MRILKIAGLAVLLLALTACNTVDTRIREKEYVFNRLDPQTQDKIRHGIVEVGYTQDMVYIALGPPDARQEKTTAKGTESTWIYRTYYEDFEGMEHVGYRRIVVYDPIGRIYRVYYEPVSAPVYSEHAEDTIRVTFVNGKVAAIEQSK